MEGGKRRPGRPTGSGAQLPPVERNRQSRERRAAGGGARLDVMLDPASTEKLTRLMEQWNCGTKKEAVERALAIVYLSLTGK